jgi:AcrR family transcriptional regulator
MGGEAAPRTAAALSDAQGTRQRILDIALGLFATRGYAGTSVADIANGLGTSKAALYYHFTSKAEILDALLTEPTREYARLADRAAAGTLTRGGLLAELIDSIAGSRVLTGVVTRDPSVMRVVVERAACPNPQEQLDAILAVLAGPEPDPAALIRAHAAFSVAKDTTLAQMSQRGGVLPPADRAEILAAAERALSGGDRPG